MQYTLLIQSDYAAYATLPPADVQANWGAHIGYAQALAEAGVSRGGSVLQPANATTTLRRPADGALDERVVTDGPFAETKEQLGGYYVIEVADLDEALVWARRLPLLPGEGLEIRPAMPTDGNTPDNGDGDTPDDATGPRA